MEVVWNGTMDRARQLADQSAPERAIDVTTRPAAAKAQLSVVEVLFTANALTAKQIAARMGVIDQLVHNRIRELVARGVVYAVDRKAGHNARRWALTQEYRLRRIAREKEHSHATSVS